MRSEETNKIPERNFHLDMILLFSMDMAMSFVPMGILTPIICDNLNEIIGGLIEKKNGL
jgi:hypothetical protein